MLAAAHSKLWQSHTIGILSQSIRDCKSSDATARNDEIVHRFIAQLASLNHSRGATQIRATVHANGAAQAEGDNWQQHAHVAAG